MNQKSKKQLNNQQLQGLGQVQLNQNGRPKQAIILYQLTPQMIDSAKQKIQKDTNFLPNNRYEEAKQKAAKVWDNFYSHHKCNFFKDRNYLEREIKQLKYFRQKHQQYKQKYVYCEIGCGVGNTLFPLLRQYDFFSYQGFDISAQAIKLIQQQMQNHPQYKQRLTVKVCDIVKDPIPQQFSEIKPDLLSMIFVLSAIVPQKHQQVITKIAKWMKPGSCFFFRDYGRYDFGQVNISNKGNRKLKQNFYVKHDGVCVYYFEQEELQKLIEDAGLVKVEGGVHCRLLQNRKTGLKMYRIWVQGRFYKPPIHPFFLQRIQKQSKQQVKEQPKLQNNQQRQVQNNNKQLISNKLQNKQKKYIQQQKILQKQVYQTGNNHLLQNQERKVQSDK